MIKACMALILLKKIIIMIDKGNDSITVTTTPTEFEELGEIDFTEMNILFYYEIKSTRLEAFLKSMVYDREYVKTLMDFE